MQEIIKHQRKKWTESLHAAVIERLEAASVQTISEDMVKEVCRGSLAANNPSIPIAEQECIIKNVLDTIFHFGPLSSLLSDDSISEIMINGLSSLYVEREGCLVSADPCFGSEEEIVSTINRLISTVGRRLDQSHPMVDARLSDGSRINAIIRPLSLIGPLVTIRRFAKNILHMSDLVRSGTLSADMERFLLASILHKRNIVIAGGAGSGKTTLLNALASTISPNERIVTIEDSAELRLSHPHWVALESRLPNVEGAGEVSVRMLLKNALRMRPDRILVGEVRGAEALDMLQAMNTGHRGSITTVHANTPIESLFRIETMAALGDSNIPLFAIRDHIREAIHIVVQLERLNDGQRKVVSICELMPKKDTQNSAYEVREIFCYDRSSRVFAAHKQNE